MVDRASQLCLASVTDVPEVDDDKHQALRDVPGPFLSGLVGMRSFPLAALGNLQKEI